MLMIVCVHVLNLMTGQTQQSELVELSMSEKIQLLSEAQTQITSTPFKTGELVTHYAHTLCTSIHVYNTHTRTHTHTHAHTLICRIQYAHQGHSRSL